MSFQHLTKHPNALAFRIYPLLQESYDRLYEHPAYAGLRLRQALEELGRFRYWSKLGYPLEGDGEEWYIHKMAYRIYQRVSSVLHVDRVDPLDKRNVFRIVRHQLKNMHELLQTLYPDKQSRYRHPAAPDEELDQQGFQQVLDALDDFDDLVNARGMHLLELNEEMYQKTRQEHEQLIKESLQGLQKWQQDVLYFWLDIIDQSRDRAMRRYSEELTQKQITRMNRLLHCGQREAVDSVYEFLWRRQQAAVNDFEFERAYHDTQALVEVASSKLQITEASLARHRDPLRGNILSTYGRILCFHAHAYEAPAELSKAIEFFELAEKDLVDREDWEAQKWLILHALLERKRLDPSLDVDMKKAIPIIELLDRNISRYIDGKYEEEEPRIDLQIAVRLKASLILSYPFPRLQKLVAHLANMVQQEANFLHHPWEQIAGLICALMPNNAPKSMRKLLREFAKISPSAEESMLGLVARFYLLEIGYRKGDLHPDNQGEQVLQLPTDAAEWWDTYEIQNRFVRCCDKNAAGSPLDVLPFDFA